MNSNIENPNPNEHHPELDPRLQSAVWAVLSEPIDGDAIDRVKQRAHENMQSDSKVPELPNAAVNTSVWRVALPLLAIAASVLFALSLMMTPQSAFAQVIERIKQIDSATFTIEFGGDKQARDLTAIATVKRPDRLRFDFKTPVQRVNVTDYSKGELISYDVDSDQVTAHEIPKADAGFDILQQLQDSQQEAIAINEQNEIEGTDLYSIFGGRGKIWVDGNTKLPTRIEIDAPDEFAVSRLVYRDFSWDVPVDDSLFEVPSGRTIVRNSLLAEATEGELIAAFRLRHAFDRSVYDSTFLNDGVALRLGRIAYDLSKSRAENSALQQEVLKDHFVELGISMAQSQDSAAIQKRIDYLCMKLDQWETRISRTGGWVGAGVRPGDQQPLCWWKTKGKIRVLRADLAIVDSDVPPVK